MRPHSKLYKCREWVAHLPPLTLGIGMLALLWLIPAAAAVLQ